MFYTISCYCIGVKESNIQAGTYKQLIQLCIVTVHVPQDKNWHLSVEIIVGKSFTIERKLQNL